MELREFIKDTLIEIAEGVNDAKEEYGKLKGEIADRGRCVVKFNIALNQIEKNDSKKGIGVMLPAIKIGGNKAEELSLSSMTRIEFEVVVKLP